MLKFQLYFLFRAIYAINYTLRCDILIIAIYVITSALKIGFAPILLCSISINTKNIFAKTNSQIKQAGNFDGSIF